MNWVMSLWSSSYALTIAFRVLTCLTIACSALLFVVKMRQDTLSSSKAQLQNSRITDQARKIGEQDQSIATLTAHAVELQQKADLLSHQAINAKRNVADTFDFNGTRRIRQGARTTVVAGAEMNTFQEMVSLHEAKSWAGLYDVASKQIAATPTWLTPYLFAGVAAGQLGNSHEARRLLTHLVEQSGDDPNYAEAQRLLSLLPQ